MNFTQFLATSSLRFPEKTALAVGQRRLTYAQLQQRVFSIADSLSGLGFGPGKHLALASKNCLEYPEIVFACAHLGVTAVLLNWRLNTQDLLHLLERNDAEGVLLNLGDVERERAITQGLAGRIPVFHLGPCAGGRSYADLLAGDPSPRPASHLPENHPLMHIHTSGTTGVPKPVVYTHGNFTKEILAYLYQLGMTSDTVSLQMTQMFHAACIAMFSSIAAGATVISLDRFDIVEYLSTVQRERVTRLGVIPSILRQILTYPKLRDYDLTSVQEIAYSTAPMPPHLIRRAMDLLPCRYYTTYGMTEMGPIVTAMGPIEHQQERLLSSVGRPIPGCDVRIVSADHLPCPPGVTGEIAVRGFGQMQGYYGMPEATAAAIRDGWFYTGDLGYLDREGYLYLQGRRSNMIITGGENVYPTEVQNALLALSTDVYEAAVYGVPDDTWGEAVVASVVLAPDSSLSGEDLRRLCRERLAGYQVPKHIFLETSLPRNQVGKVLIKPLAERYPQRLQEELSGANTHRKEGLT